MEYILKTYNLTKKYGNTSVVDNVNMNIKRGEIYGFLGRNGAGKTTTLRMVMGLISPTKGRVGAIIETPGFYPNLTARENLDIHRRLMGIPNKEYIDEALEIVGLNNYDIKKKKVKKYSLGMKQRLGVARALLHKPELLILDEPTNGLDPVGIREMRETLIELNKKREITILISSHILGEIQQLATNIGIIHNGKLLEEIDYNSLQKKNRHYINLKVNDDKSAVTILENDIKIKDYMVLSPNNIRVYEMLDKSNYIAKTLISKGLEVYEVNVMNDTLEDYFVKLTGGEQHA